MMEDLYDMLESMDRKEIVGILKRNPHANQLQEVCLSMIGTALVFGKMGELELQGEVFGELIHAVFYIGYRQGKAEAFFSSIKVAEG